MPALEDVSTFNFLSADEDDGAMTDMNNLDTTIQVNPIPNTRIHKDHPLDQVIRDLQSAKQTRKMSKNLDEHGFIKEEVYVCQPPGFEDLDFHDRVYKVEKALYGLHQAPRAWYETLSTYLLDNGFQRGKIDKTLFIKRHKGDILLVQVYVDDIIIGSIKKDLCNSFEREYELWSMRMEQYLTFTDYALWEDAKSLWEAIKNKFGGNKESRKMQKTILKQHYENIAASTQEGLDKTYDRFQKLISQLEIHGEV
nr:reverse transcriptase [Tanacetum cinerariifolium]